MSVTLQQQQALEILAFKGADVSFYERVVQALALASGYRWAAIFRLLPDKTQVCAEAFWSDGALGEPFQFALQGTPCGELYETKALGTSPVFFNRLKQRYPKFDLLDAECYQAALFFDASGQPAGHIATLDDKPRQQTEADQHFFYLLAQRIGAEYQQIELKKALMLHSQMIEHTQHMMSFVDRDYIYRVVSGGYEELMGLPPGDIVGRPVVELHGEEVFHGGIKEGLDRCFAGEKVHMRLWVSPCGRQPTFVDVNKAPFFDDRGNIIGVIVSAHDITESKMYEDKIAEVAHLDPLTGLPNRRYLFERLKEALAKYRRHSGSCTVFYIDLDDFKQINDTFGHAAGDKVLMAIANRLKATVREEDVLARIGGDEFVLLITNGTECGCESTMLAQKIVDEISRPIDTELGMLSISASVGVHVIGEDDASTDDVLKRADLAMYRSKQNGRNQYQQG